MPRSSLVLGLLGAMWCGLPAMAAPAESPWPVIPEHEDRAESAAEAEYRGLLASGDELAIHALEVRSMRMVRRRREWVPSSTLALRAVSVYERAAEVRPDAAEPHYRAAEVLRAHFLDAPPEPVLEDRELAERALAHWRAFEERAPLDPRVTDTLFDRALVRTRLATEADFERAIAHYQTLLARSDLRSLPGEQVATWLGNLAETYMMVGRLDHAIEMYRRSLEYRAEPACGYGLAVALDRDGQTALAREVMASYAATDELRDLRRGTVFFVPEGEVDYYLALGYEALGKPAQAAEHYRRFLASGAHPRYQPRARENLRRVESASDRRGRSGARPRGARRGSGP